MQKPRVLLAFGYKGNQTKMPDKKFFRSAVSPFLEKHVRQEGGRAVVVHALNTADLFDFSEEQKRAAVLSLNIRRGDFDPELEDLRSHQMKQVIDIMTDAFTQIESRLNVRMASTMDMGKAMDGFKRDWGFHGTILSINQERPGAVRNILEPQTFESACLYWELEATKSRAKEHLLDSDAIDLMLKYIRSTGKLLAERDFSTVARIKAISGREPDTAFVVPRGFMHRGMIMYFEDDFELDVKQAVLGGGIPTQFMQAVIGSYTGHMSSRELLLTATNVVAAHREMEHSRIEFENLVNTWGLPIGEA
ncbi:hypothetical protein GF318_05050 [Candidatus Micrarchaeota archaeon]|nr:hypothetical protein [Candidatus Micrarchaeota archaeon]